MKFLAPYFGALVVLIAGFSTIGYYLTWPWWVLALSLLGSTVMVILKLVWDINGFQGGYGF